jgi:hypothetical protein
LRQVHVCLFECKQDSEACDSNNLDVQSLDFAENRCLVFVIANRVVSQPKEWWSTQEIRRVEGRPERRGISFLIVRVKIISELDLTKCPGYGGHNRGNLYCYLVVDLSHPTVRFVKIRYVLSCILWQPVYFVSHIRDLWTIKNETIAERPTVTPTILWGHGCRTRWTLWYCLSPNESVTIKITQHALQHVCQSCQRPRSLYGYTYRWEEWKPAKSSTNSIHRCADERTSNNSASSHPTVFPPTSRIPTKKRAKIATCVRTKKDLIRPSILIDRQLN